MDVREVFDGDITLSVNVADRSLRSKAGVVMNEMSDIAKQTGEELERTVARMGEKKGRVEQNEFVAQRSRELFYDLLAHALYSGAAEMEIAGLYIPNGAMPAMAEVGNVHNSMPRPSYLRLETIGPEVVPKILERLQQLGREEKSLERFARMDPSLYTNVITATLNRETILGLDTYTDLFLIGRPGPGRTEFLRHPKNARRSPRALKYDPSLDIAFTHEVLPVRLRFGSDATILAKHQLPRLNEECVIAAYTFGTLNVHSERDEQRLAAVKSVYGMMAERAKSIAGSVWRQYTTVPAPSP